MLSTAHRREKFCHFGENGLIRWDIQIKSDICNYKMVIGFVHRIYICVYRYHKYVFISANINCDCVEVVFFCFRFATRSTFWPIDACVWCLCLCLCVNFLRCVSLIVSGFNFLLYFGTTVKSKYIFTPPSLLHHSPHDRMVMCTWIRPFLFFSFSYAYIKVKWKWNFRVQYFEGSKCANEWMGSYCVYDGSDRFLKQSSRKMQTVYGHRIPHMNQQPTYAMVCIFCGLSYFVSNIGINGGCCCYVFLFCFFFHFSFNVQPPQLVLPSFQSYMNGRSLVMLISTFWTEETWKYVKLVWEIHWKSHPNMNFM